MNPRYLGWPPNMPAALDLPALPATSVLAGSARRYGDRLALRHADRTLTFTELYQRSCALAHRLTAQGLGRGDVVAVHLPNHVDYPVAYFGTLLAGATAAPLSPMLRPAELREQLGVCHARAVITDVVGDPITGDGRDGAPRLVWLDPSGRPDEALDAGRAAAPPTVAVDGDDVAHLVFSGGTTGQPKAVTVLHRNLLAETLQYACWRTGALPAPDGQGGVVLDPVEGDYLIRPGQATALTSAPLFHSMGLVGLSQHVASGTTLITMPRFSARTFLDLVDEHRVQHLLGAPAMFAGVLEDPSLHAHDRTSVRAIGCASAPVPPSLTARMLRAFPNARVCQSYGLTEATLVATVVPFTRSAPEKPESCGIPLPGTEITLRDGVGAEVATGEVGEIWIRGPQVTPGYLDRPEATAAAFVDGWLRTGDLGRLDSDGYLSIAGRLKEMLIYKGYNVYPAELEELLLRHDAVESAAVVGRPDEAAGERPVGFVVLRREFSSEEILAFVNDQVSTVKRLHELHVLDELPRSPIGKVRKNVLQERLTG
ncbi:MAG: AMP-binding protein [Actinobacteria bacterium]|nr:AMP-binding protein [Actinomycetota bacterium]